MKNLAAKAQRVLDNSAVIREFAGEIAAGRSLFYMGRGLDYAVAMEGSLKLKEVSYIHAEA